MAVVLATESILQSAAEAAGLTKALRYIEQFLWYLPLIDVLCEKNADHSPYAGRWLCLFRGSGR
jgi:hypothetical protein